MSFLGKDTSNKDFYRANNVKEAIKCNLQDRVRELQNEYKDDDDEALENNEITDGLCIILEALFIHGLKDSFFGRFFGSSSTSSNRLPEPSFWCFVLIFTHKDMLRRIDSLSQVRTDVGRSRTWIRMALNDGTFESFLESIAKDPESARKHYGRYALIRDEETLDFVRDVIKGISSFRFLLACNSSILNTWQAKPLVLAGLWSPDNVKEVVEKCEEVVEDEEIATEAIDPPPSATSSHFLPGRLLNEDDALRIILQSSSPRNSDLSPVRPASRPDSQQSSTPKRILSPPTHSPLGSPPPVGTPDNRISGHPDTRTPEPQIEDLPDESVVPESDTSSYIDIYQRLNSSQSTQDSEKQDDGTAEDETNEPLTDPETEKGSSGSEGSSTPEDRSPSPEPVPSKPDFTLPEPGPSPGIHNLVSTAAAMIINNTFPTLSGFIEAWNPFARGRDFDELPELPQPTSYGFDLNDHASVGCLDVRDTRTLMGFFDRIPVDAGLNEQNWQCEGCSKAIGTIFGPAKSCTYTRKYYCDECHLDERAAIPAKIVFNWDFRRYAVSHKAKLFLDAMNAEPVIQSKHLGERILEFAPSLRDVVDLRKRLQFMYAYLLTCSKSTANEKFRQMIGTRTYMYAKEGTFAIRDFEQIQSGELKSLLKNCYQFCHEHILHCELCRFKGFNCEKCRSGPIYPFDMEATVQCQTCHAVYHSACMKEVAPHCLKCDRIAERDLVKHVNELGVKMKSQKNSDDNEEAVEETK